MTKRSDHNGRFVITERTHLRHPVDKPMYTWAEANDPIAGIIQRYTGVFDLRDTKYPGAIVASAKFERLMELRKLQAKLNTRQWFNANFHGC